MKFIRIGNRLLNLEAISSAAYHERPIADGGRLLNIWTWEQECEQYEGHEAEALWAFLTAAGNCRTLPTVERWAGDRMFPGMLLPDAE